MRRITAALTILAVASGVAGAQVIVRSPSRSLAMVGAEDGSRAMLGVTTSPSGERDTLGLLVTSVESGGPAERAGLEEGNRLQSINGVNLRLSRDDAGDDFMQGINQNRLLREMRKVKAGDDVTLEVWGGGRTRTVKVKTVSADDLSPKRNAETWVERRTDDRPAIGIYLAATGTKRDTAGVFVEQVLTGGPAEKAGIIEGDRIASINGVDVRVAREDAGDPNAGAARIDRLQRELGKLKVGDVADLVVVSGGRSRTVKVTTARMSDVPGMGGAGFGFGNGDEVRTFTMPGGRGLIVAPDGAMPRIQLRGMDGEAMRQRIEDGMMRLRRIGPGVRAEIDDSIRDDLDRELPRAMDDARETLRWELPQAMDRLREQLRDLPLRVRVRSTRSMI